MLGVTLGSDFSWNDHISPAPKAAACKFGLLFRSRPGLSNPRPSKAMNAARHKITNFLKTLRFLCYCKTYLIQFDLIIFLFFSKIIRNSENENRPTSFRRIKGKFSSLKVKKYIKNSGKNNHNFGIRILSHFYRFKYFTWKLSD